VGTLVFPVWASVAVKAGQTFTLVAAVEGVLLKKAALLGVEPFPVSSNSTV
jgi:hypothetical protein